MLLRATNSHGEIKVRLYRLTRYSDDGAGRRQPPLITRHRCAADSATPYLNQFFEEFEALGTTNPSATGDYNLSIFKPHPLYLLHYSIHQLCSYGQRVYLHLDIFYFTFPRTIRFKWRYCPWLYGCQLGTRILRDYDRYSIPPINRPCLH